MVPGRRQNGARLSVEIVINTQQMPSLSVGLVAWEEKEETMQQADPRDRNSINCVCNLEIGELLILKAQCQRRVLW